MAQIIVQKESTKRMEVQEMLSFPHFDDNIRHCSK